MDATFRMFVETEVPRDEIIISRTDLKGIITYANETFAEISGYSVNELIGKPHNILRHPDMPKSLFKHLWDTIKSGKMWSGYVKNLRKDGGYYWVYAEVSGVYKEGRLFEFKSMRSYVERPKRLEMQTLYDKMREEEKGNIRTVMYLPYEIFKKIENLALAENRTGEAVIQNIFERL